MTTTTTWPLGTRVTDDGRASLYDLLTTRGLRSPRDAWAKLRRRCPHVADVVSSAIISGHQATPVVTEAAWVTLVAAMGDAPSTTATLVGDAASATLMESLQNNEATLATLVGDAPATLPLSVSQDEIDALMAVIDELREERDGLVELLQRLDDHHRNSGDDADDVDVEQWIESLLAGTSEVDRRDYQTELLRAEEAAERKARDAKFPRVTPTTKKKLISMDEMLARGAAKRAEKAAAVAVVEAPPKTVIPSTVEDDGAPIDSEDDMGGEDYDEGDDEDTPEQIAKWRQLDERGWSE